MGGYITSAAAAAHQHDLTHALLGQPGKPRSLIRFVRDRPDDRRYAIDCERSNTSSVEACVAFCRGPQRHGAGTATRAWVANIRNGEYRNTTSGIRRDFGS